MGFFGCPKGRPIYYAVLYNAWALSPQLEQYYLKTDRNKKYVECLCVFIVAFYNSDNTLRTLVSLGKPWEKTLPRSINAIFYNAWAFSQQLKQDYLKTEWNKGMANDYMY
ncbi:unnamed protein product [Meganyctiphanes norvegica]|uniref:Uncharacterized protein n=1 Tax=Meganyctiphanes norvegica TaxID=48144 RepID=A0AAV2PKU1_MEGNR